MADYNFDFDAPSANTSGYNFDFDTPPQLSLLEQKLADINKAKEEKLTGVIAWNQKSLVEKIGLGTWGGLEQAVGNVVQAPGNIVQSFGRGVLEPESALMQRQATTAENNLRNLSRQIAAETQRTGGIVSSNLLEQQQVEGEKLYQAQTWLAHPVNTERTSGVLGKFAPKLFGSTYTRADALVGNERIAENFDAATMFGDVLKESGKSRVNQSQYEEVNPIFDAASKDAAKAWEEGNAVTGALGFVGNSLLGIAKAVATDPASAAVKMSESLVNTLAAANVVSAGINYGALFTSGRETAYKDFQKEHGGKLPTASESAVIDTAIGASVLSELGGNVLQIKMVPALNKILKGNKDVIPDTLKADLVSKYPKLGELAKETGKLALIPTAEGAQGGFQEIADQFAVKQDTAKIDVEKVAKGAIEEGFAASSMAGVAAVSTPGKVLAEGHKNEGLKQSTEVTDAFKQTEAYKSLSEVKQAPVAAYRAFEATLKDEASTPEQKQTAFNTAVGALINTPQFNTQKLASELVKKAEALGVTVPDAIATVLTDLSKSSSGVMDSVTKTINKGIQRVRTNADEKAEITDELINKDPVFAMELLSNKEIKSTDKATYDAARAEVIDTFVRINKAASKGLPENSTKRMNESVAAFAERIQQLDKSFNPIKDVVEAIVNPKPNQKDSFGSSPAALNGREDELSENQLDALIAAPAVSEEQKTVLKAFKELKSKKSTGEVSKNILEASDGKKISLADHVAAITTGITLGNKSQAETSLNLLKKFAEEYAVKAAEVATAYKEVVGTNKVKMVSQINSAFKALEIRDNYSKGLVANIASDNALIQAKFLQAQNYFNTVFNAPKTTPVKDETPIVVSPLQAELQALLDANTGKDKVWDIAAKQAIESNDSGRIQTVINVGKKKFSTPQGEPSVAKTEETITPKQGPKEAEVSSPVVRLKAGVFTVIPKILEKARGLYLIAVKKNPDAVEKTKEAEENLPKYSFGESIFTKENNVISVLASNPLLKETAKQIQALSDTIAASLKGNNPKEGGTMFQSLADNPAIAFMQIEGKGFQESLVANPVITEAIAIVAHNYIGTQAGGLMVNTDFTIKRMLGLDAKDRVPRKAQILRYAGTNMNNLADDLGTEIMQLLNMSVDSNNKSVDRKRMQHALGFMAIKGLLDLGYVEQNPIKKEDYLALFDKEFSEEDIEEGADRIVFISVPLNKDESGTPLLVDKRVVAVKSVQDIRDTYKNVAFKDALDTAIKDLTKSTIRPITKTGRKLPEYLKNTFQILSDAAKKALNVVNDRPYTFNTTAFNTFLLMRNNEDTYIPLLESLGYVSDLSKLSAYNRPGVEAANLLILREIDDLLEFKKQLDITGKKEFYFNHEIWKNSRIGLSGDSGINPQASKIVRHLVTLDSFNIKLGPELQGEARTNAIDAIKVSIAAGFDIDPGKKDKATVLAKLQEEMDDSNSTLSIALKAPSKENIIAIMKQYGMKTHTLESFIALQELLAYERDEKKSVTVRTAVELDGKTNGVAISLAQFFGVPAADLPLILKKVGLFTNESDVQYLSANKGIDDLYETISRGWAVNVKKGISTATKETKELWNIQQSYIGDVLTEEKDESGNPILDEKGNRKFKVDKAAREASKYPFMKTIFGQSIDTLKGDFGNELVARIYKKIEDLNNKQYTPEEIAFKLIQINKDIEILSGEKGTFTFDNFMTHELSFVITNRIADSARETYGKALADAIDEKFKPFYELRNVLNNSVTAMSNLFIGLVKERAKKDKVPITNELLKELMEKTVAEGGLKEFVPNLMTAHSKTLEEGFIALKKYSKRSGDIKTKVQVNYSGKPIQNNWLDGRKTKTDSHTGGIKEVSLENAGVGTMIGLIHSFDGAQMQTIISELEAFGVHDAWLINALEAEKAGGRLNEVFRKQNEEYSIAEVIENRFNEIQKLVASTTTGLISPELLAAFKEDAAKANTPKGFGGTQPIGFEKAMKDIKAARIRWFNEIKHWAQFVFENSSFPGKTMEATSAAVEPVVETLVAELPVEPTVVSIQTTVTDPVSQETRSKIDSIIDPILAKVTAVQRDEFKSFLNELYRSVNPNAGDLKIGITDSKAKAGKQYYFDSETNTVYVPDNMKQLVGLVHELLHAATFFGVYQGLAEGNRDIVDFKNFLASHKDAILAKLKGKKNKEANQIRYIYEVPADQRKENMADYAERSIVEALVVLGSNTSIRAEWVQLLKEVDPSTAKKVDGLFGQLYEYISKLADEFFLLLMRRDKDEKTPVEQTKALELYYRALAASMKLNPTAPTTITPQKVYQKGDSFTFTSGGETATVKAKVVVDFAGTQIIIHENIEGHTPKYRATEQSTGSYINLDPNIKTIKGIVEALNNRLADIGEQKMKEVIAKFHANKTTASSISLDEQSVLDNLSPKEIADTIESLICRGAK